MCGLFASSKKLNSNEISKILQRLGSRGPDDTKVRSNSMGTYIFSRLEITGRDTIYMQPLEKTNADKKDFFLFNGEIYNYKEIKKKFNLSYKKGFSDTRVLSYLLDKFPFQKAIKHLNGMYAIAKINDNFKEVILSRDTFGQKPLYYSLYQKNWYISSDPYAIAYVTDCKLNNLQLKNYLISNEDFGTRGLLTGDSFFKNIKEVPANSIVKINKYRVEFKKTFYNNIFIKKKIKKQRSEEEIVLNLKKIIEKVVKNYCKNHEDIAFTFSGGIDSTILLFASLKLKKKFKYYTKIADKIDKIANNSVRLLKKLGIQKFKRIKIYKKNYLSDLIDFIIYSGSPARWGTAPSMVPLYKQMYLDDIKICIGGDGADELFYGYPNTEKLIKSFNNNEINFDDPIKILKDFSLSGWIQTKDNNLKLYKESLKKKVKMFGSKNVFLKKDKLLFLSSLIQYIDFGNFLSKVVTPHSDCCSMKYSIELRSPYLDKSIVNEAMSFDVQKNTFKNSKYRSKYFLKKVLEKQCIENNIDISEVLKDKEGTRNFAIQSAEKVNLTNLPKNFLNFLKIKINKKITPKTKYKIVSLAIFYLYFEMNYKKSKILSILTKK